MEEIKEKNSNEFEWDDDLVPINAKAAAKVEKFRRNSEKLWRSLRENPPPPEFYEMLEHRGCWNDRLIR
jgi:hypothetical protein